MLQCLLLPQKQSIFCKKYKKILTKKKGAETVEKKKLVYESPELEVIEIELEDIVTTSTSGIAGNGSPNEGDMDDWTK